MPRSSNAIKMRQRLEMRAAEEEDMMTRVPLSRDQVWRVQSLWVVRCTKTFMS